MLLQSALYDTHDPFDLFDGVETIKKPEDIKEGACLLLHGGSDISPTLYNHKVSKYCHAGSYVTPRDATERDMINQAVALGNPIIGICRGAQLLCAVDGGHLVQHIIGHGNNGHQVLSQQYGNLGVSNTAHHQMMVPRRTKYNQTIGFVDETIHGFEQEDKLRVYTSTPEIVYFEELNGLGIQGHPEWMERTNDYLLSLRRIIKDYLLKGTT